MKKIIKGVINAVTIKEKNRIALFIFLNTIVNLADILCVVGLLFVVRLYTQPATSALPGLHSGTLFSSTSLVPALLLVGMFAIKNAAGYFVYRAQSRFINSVTVRISQQNLANYLRGPYSNYSGTDSAVYVSKIIYQPTEFAQFVLQGIQQMVTESILVLFSAAALLLYNAQLFAVVCLALLPAILVLSWINKKKLDAIKQNIQRTAEQAHQYVNEALKGYVESNIYARNDFFINRHAVAQEKLGGYVTGLKITQDMPARFFEVFAVMGLFILIVFTRLGSSSGNTVILIGAFMAAAYKIIPGIAKIITQAGFIKAYSHTITTAGEAAIPNKVQEGKSEPITSIECTMVDFAYGDLKILSNFNSIMRAGSFTGISGKSGSGKTTLLQLLAGFCKPANGAVLVNGRSVDDAAGYLKNIAYVKQEPFIVHDSIVNNIVLFEDEYDEARLKTILQITGVNEIAGHYPAGIHKNIMEAGRNISGGQRQRIAIARALYKNASLILLDEPFSELDEASETKMLVYLKQLATEGKIVVLISHSLHSFRYCDSVINF